MYSLDVSVKSTSTAFFHSQIYLPLNIIDVQFGCVC